MDGCSYRNFYESISLTIIDNLVTIKRLEHHAQQFYFKRIKAKPLLCTSIVDDFFRLGNSNPFFYF
jgi:hypothetical protein